MVNFYVYKDVVVEGINLAGDPTWGYFGMFATGIMVYFARHFSHRMLYQVYISPDKRRIGFQFHNMFASPGRKVEVSLGKAQFLSPLDPNFVNALKDENTEIATKSGSLLSSSLVPVKVQGIDGNVLIDKEGLVKNRQAAGELIEILTKGEALLIDSKEKREEWRKNLKAAKRRK